MSERPIELLPCESESSWTQKTHSHRKWHHQWQKPRCWFKHYTDCRADWKDPCNRAECEFRCCLIWWNQNPDKQAEVKSTHCDGWPCCSPSSCCPGKPCRCRWKASHQPAEPRWGGTEWEWPGWRCSSCGPLWTHTRQHWVRCCPPAGCPADTHSRGRGPGRWVETHNPPWHFAPGKLDRETSEVHVERTET